MIIRSGLQVMAANRVCHNPDSRMRRDFADREIVDFEICRFRFSRSRILGFLVSADPEIAVGHFPPRPRVGGEQLASIAAPLFPIATPGRDPADLARFPGLHPLHQYAGAFLLLSTLCP
jgi:hypothetical protein